MRFGSKVTEGELKCAVMLFLFALGQRTCENPKDRREQERTTSQEEVRKVSFISRPGSSRPIWLTTRFFRIPSWTRCFQQALHSPARKVLDGDEWSVSAEWASGKYPAMSFGKYTIIHFSLCCTFLNWFCVVFRRKGAELKLREELRQNLITFSQEVIFTSTPSTFSTLGVLPSIFPLVGWLVLLSEDYATSFWIIYLNVLGSLIKSKVVVGAMTEVEVVDECKW